MRQGNQVVNRKQITQGRSVVKLVLSLTSSVMIVCFAPKLLASNNGTDVFGNSIEMNTLQDGDAFAPGGHGGGGAPPPPHGGGDHGGGHGGGDHGGGHGGGDHGWPGHGGGDHGWPGHGGGDHGWPGHGYHHDYYVCFAADSRSNTFQDWNDDRFVAEERAMNLCEAETPVGGCYIHHCDFYFQP